MWPASSSHALQLLLLASLMAAASAQGSSGWQSGTIGELGYGTTYNPASGACGYGALPDGAWPFGGLAAIDPAASPLAVGATQQGCGMCLEVQCEDTACGPAPQSLVVLIIDFCSGCGAGAIYLAPAAYAKMAPGLPLGQVSGRFRRVNCNPPGNVQVHVDTYRATEGGWLRLALTQVAGAGDIASIQLAPSQSPEAWRPMQRSFGATWELSSLPPPPLDLKATDATGQTVVARQVLQQAGQTGDVPTSTQFQASAALAAALGQPAPAAAVPPALPPPPAPAPALEARGPTSFQSVFGPVPAAPAPLVTAAPTGAPAPESILLPPSPGAPPLPLPLPTSPSASLPLPATPASAPPVVDTRPPRPPGVGPSVTPAPVVYSPVAGLPTLPSEPAAVGPVSGQQLAATAGIDSASCQTLGAILAQIPQAQNWTQLLKAQGLDRLLGDKSAQVTLLVPIDSALDAAIDARPLRNESSLAQLILNAPEIQTPLVGYHVLPALWPSWTLQPGTSIPTSDTIDKVNPLQITAQGPTQLQGIGTSANILQGDIVACGPSIIHIIDQVLLPFKFDQAAIDAVTGTTAPLPPSSAPLSSAVLASPPPAQALTPLSLQGSPVSSPPTGS
ncbi:hypothetical protein ABPG77_000369 [Micractinium sp. CCAP 211/92]